MQTIVNTAMLAPAAALVVWSLVMLVWMARTRFPAMARAGFKLADAQPGGRGQDLEPVLPPQVMWKSHNYTHLMEQPTLFYATVVILALAGGGTVDVVLGWAYVALRVVHSVWQATVNRIPTRVLLFQLYTLVLAAMALHALWLTLWPGLRATL